jgi:hypothetical protein
MEDKLVRIKMQRYKQLFKEDNDWNSLIEKINSYKKGSLFQSKIFHTGKENIVFGNIVFKNKKIKITNTNLTIFISKNDFLNFSKYDFSFWKTSDENENMIFIYSNTAKICMSLYFMEV